MINKEQSLKKQFIKRLNKAIKKNGYLSLRSIIESSYYYPRHFIIEPIKKGDINKNIAPTKL